jgi:Lipoprotein confined to pathogenic Mycobacterium
MTRIPRALTIVAMTLALTTACSLESETSMEHRQFAELMQRPDSDQAVARYEDMYAKIRTQLTTTFPQFTWYISDPPGGASCGREFDALDKTGTTYDAVTKGLANWAANGGLSDAQWEQALTVIRPIVHSYGFSTEVRTLDRPRDHQVDFFDPYGANFQLGAAVNTTLLLITGCHLTPEAKRRGTPAPASHY